MPSFIPTTNPGPTPRTTVYHPTPFSLHHPPTRGLKVLPPTPPYHTPTPGRNHSLTPTPGRKVPRPTPVYPRPTPGPHPPPLYPPPTPGLRAPRPTPLYSRPTPGPRAPRPPPLYPVRP